MLDEAYWQIFLNAALVNNFVLAYFLGICPFLGVSGNLGTATRMGISVTLIMLISSVCAYSMHALLILIQAPYLELLSFILVIASTVQMLEIMLKKVNPVLFRTLGIFLPLITTNCAILGLALFQTNKGYQLMQCIVYALGAGVGFTLALVLMAGLRVKLSLSTTSELARGTAATLFLAGILSLTFMGFSGLGAP
ncbi:MAG: electron transport complex subunit A [Gammaproteobacteria bacterium]|nr:electron transport complex subunit A [Gammaproteobacteria bacterium]MDH5802941.1 electron transport complex subunit A [Gammaproteobacteria bacterium]